MKRILFLYIFYILIHPTLGNTKIVFNSIDEGFTGMYVMDDDGSNLKLLTRELIPAKPNWSPDGKQIVFEQYNGNPISPSYHIALMNADGTNIRQLTTPINGSDYYPTFSPDGKQILFTRYQNKIKRRSINTLNIESGEIIELVNLNESLPRHPNYSPDGKQIVFSSEQFDEGLRNLWIMDADGENLRILLPNPENREHIIQRNFPKWSPDGNHILYTHSEYIDQQVGQVVASIHKAHRYMICDRNGENIVELDIPMNWKPEGVDWMDDGESVLLSMQEIELNKLEFLEVFDYHIYKYNITTKDLTELTNPQVDGYEVDWISGSALSVSPKSKKLMQWGKIKVYSTRYR